MTANSVVNQIIQSESFVLQKGLNCTKPTIQCSWYRRPFPVLTHDSRRLVHQKAFSCTKPTIQCSWYTRKPFPVPNPRFNAVGTPDGLFLYQPTIQCSWYTRRPFPVQTHDSMQLVHQKAFSCTKPTIQCSWYTRKPFPVPNPRFNAVGTPDGLFLYQLQSSN